MKELRIESQKPGREPDLCLRAGGLWLCRGPQEVQACDLTELRHLECAASDQLRLSWRPTEAEEQGSVTLTVGEVRATDLRDAVEHFVHDHAPGHQFSIRDETGLRAQLPQRCAELFPARPLVSRAWLEEGTAECTDCALVTELGAWKVVRGASIALDPPPDADLSSALHLNNGLILNPEGLVLGELRRLSEAEMALRLIDGRTYRWGDITKPLRCDGQRVGLLTRRGLRSEQPIPNHLALMLLLSDLFLRPPEDGSNRHIHEPVLPPHPGLLRGAFLLITLSSLQLTWFGGGKSLTLATIITGLALIYGITAASMRRTSGWIDDPGAAQKRRIHPQQLPLRLGLLAGALWPVLVMLFRTSVLTGQGRFFTFFALYLHVAAAVMVAAMVWRRGGREAA